MEVPVIETAGVSKEFAGRRVIADFTFQVRRGETVGLLGPNGSGKTTMIRLLNGLLRPDAGSINVLGRDPIADGGAVRQASGVLTESADFYQHLSGLENLRFFAALYGVREAGRPERLLRSLGLGTALSKPAGAYSTGMRKRLGLAKALLHEPELLFLDEPTNGLDPEGTRLVLDSLRKIKEQGNRTTLICSHLLQQLELVCDRYVFIREGRLIEQGTLRELKGRYQHGVVLEVLTDLPDDRAGREYPDLTFGLARVQPESASGLRRIELQLESREDVPVVLRRLTQEARVFEAVVRAESLESLYFRIQEAAA